MGACSSKDLRAVWVLLWEQNAKPMLSEKLVSCAAYRKDVVATAVSHVPSVELKHHPRVCHFIEELCSGSRK